MRPATRGFEWVVGCACAHPERKGACHRLFIQRRCRSCRLDMSLILPLVVFITVTGAYSEYVVPPTRLRPAPYPEWAHYHWLANCHCSFSKLLLCRVWLSNDRASQASMTQYAQQYLDHGIKVGFELVSLVGFMASFSGGCCGY